MVHAEQPVTVKVDFGSIKGPAAHRASGFLHSISADQPDDRIVRQLKPKLFRRKAREALNPSIYQRLASFNAEVQSVISDAYGYPGKSRAWPGDGDDWSAWENLVEELLQDANSKGLRVLWDVWNEPDLSMFWDRSAEQFFETWKRAVNTIRRVDPKAIIVGPSLAKGAYYLYGFLLKAHANNVLPDIISWHDVSLDHPNNVSSVRQFMAKYQIPDRPISINEFQPADGKYRPGLTVWWLAHIEDEGPDSAAYACWQDPTGYWDCDVNTLDGLLTADGQARSIWFAHKGYAEITGQLVDVLIPGAKIAGIAGVDEALQSARVLLGRREFPDSSKLSTVEVVCKGLDRVSYLIEDGKIFVRAERIPDSGTLPLDRPQATIAEDYKVVDNEIRITLPDFGAWEGYTMVLGKDARNASSTLP